MSDTPPLKEATSDDTAAIFGAAPATARVPTDNRPTETPNRPIPLEEHHDVPPPPPAPSVDPAAIKHVEEKTKALAAPKKFEVKAKTAAGINYAAAFLLFCKGFSLQEIADEFGMRYAALVERARNEDWERLAKKSDTLALPPPRTEIAPFNAALLEKKQAAILANREESATLAADLRRDIRKVLSAYQQDNAFLRPDDILTLAKAEKLLQEISMVALGDDYVSKSPTGGAGGSGSSQPSIVINLPAAVSNPRLPRAVAPQQEESAHTAPVDSPDALEEVTIVGVRSAEREAVSAKSKRGHTVNFEALAEKNSPGGN